MDHNLPLMGKRIREILRAVLFMLRKGITKSKIMLELNMIIKRGKHAGKTMIGNLNFHHYHDGNDKYDDLLFSGPYEYEFSCNNSPEYFPIKLTKRHKNHYNHGVTKSNNIICARPPLTPDEHDNATLNSVKIELESGVHASQMLPYSAMVRQVRVSDSPFSLQDVNENGSQVDKAAEEFIQKFYRQLKKGK